MKADQQLLPQKYLKFGIESAWIFLEDKGLANMIDHFGQNVPQPREGDFKRPVNMGRNVHVKQD